MEELVDRIAGYEKIQLLPYQRAFVLAVLNLPEFAAFPKGCGSGKNFTLRFIRKCMIDLAHNPDLEITNMKVLTKLLPPKLIGPQ